MKVRPLDTEDIRPYLHTEKFRQGFAVLMFRKNTNGLIAGRSLAITASSRRGFRLRFHYFGRLITGLNKGLNKDDQSVIAERLAIAEKPFRTFQRKDNLVERDYRNIDFKELTTDERSHATEGVLRAYSSEGDVILISSRMVDMIDLHDLLGMSVPEEIIKDNDGRPARAA